MLVRALLACIACINKSQKVLAKSAVKFATADTGQGAREFDDVYAMNQNAETTAAVTRHGANELYDIYAMSHNAETTDTRQGAYHAISQDAECNPSGGRSLESGGRRPEKRPFNQGLPLGPPPPALPARLRRCHKRQSWSFCRRSGPSR